VSQIGLLGSIPAIETNASYIFSGALSGPGGQINYIVPSGFNADTYTVRIYNGSTLLGVGILKGEVTNPGWYTYEGGTNGTVLGAMYKYNSDGTVLEQTVNLLPSGTGTNWLSTLQAYVIGFGTGMRNASCSATIGGTSVGVTYAGPQGTYLGLDQVNIGPLPSSLKNSGTKTISLTCGGKTANAVTVTFGSGY
jgi:uncharacterized protein (TIGR03437 family)